MDDQAVKGQQPWPLFRWQVFACLKMAPGRRGQSSAASPSDPVHNAMTDREFALSCADNPKKFYNSARWIHCRKYVLEIDHHECQLCRTKYHRYRRAEVVHHVNHYKDRPDLGLSIWFTDARTHQKKRNLISLCAECHEEVHGRATPIRQDDALTEERWD